MKKIILLIAACVCVASVAAGCSATPEETPVPSTKAPATEAPAVDPTEALESTEEAVDLPELVIDIEGDALLIASSARYENSNPTYQSTHIGDWTASGSVFWETNVIKSGRYEVVLHAAAESGAGGKGTLQAGNNTVEFTVEPTGETDNFKKVNIGEISLTPGENRVTITADSDVSNYLMNLKRVEFIKLSDSIEVTNEGDVILTPDNALYGDKGPSNEGGNNIGGWKSEGVVTWELKVINPGKYEMLVYHSGDTGTGGVARFEIDGQTVDFPVEPTGDWGQFAENNAGTIALLEGDKKLQLSAAELTGEWFMNVEKVILRRLGDINVEVSGEAEAILTPDNAMYGDNGPSNEGGNNIGGWKAEGVVTWNLKVLEAGNYEMIVYHSGDTGTGGVAQIDIDGKQYVDFPVEPTGNWGEFAENNIGIVSLKEGDRALQMYAKELNGEWFMNVQKAVLRRVGDIDFTTTVGGAETTVFALAGKPEGPGIENNDTNFGGWKNDGKVTWTLNVVEAGDYEIVLSHAGDTGTGGPSIFTVGGQVIDYEIPHTGGWGTYEESVVATVTLSEGVIDFTIEGTPEANEYMMNLDYFKLIKK